MKNLRLKLDDLQVDSFETRTDARRERGTVVGFDGPAKPDATTGPEPVETYSCDCPSDWATCDYCYESGNMWQCTNDTCDMVC